MKSQMIKLIGVCSFLVSMNFAQAQFPVDPIHIHPALEAWLQLKCNGVVTPVNAYPVVYQDIATFYLKVNASSVRPTIRELTYDPQCRAEFNKIAQYCNDVRIGIASNFVPAGQIFLDWGSDYGYTRIIPGEVFVPILNVCRSVGQPCAQSTQCCGYSAQLSSPNYCNSNTNACTSSVIYQSTNKSPSAI